MPSYQEQDPWLAAVVDRQSGRNLLDPSNPKPLLVNIQAARPVRFTLQLVNGPGAGIDLAISADEPWLEAETNRLTLNRGEHGDCLLIAKPGWDTEFANILFFWEGVETTLCQSVMVRQQLAATRDPLQRAGAPATGTARRTLDSAKRDKALQTLEAFIDGCGGPDKFIDLDEEHQIFRKGGNEGLPLVEIESLLNQKCIEGGWTRQTRLTERLTALLHEATQDDGVIDEQEYERVLNFAVRRRMPRKDADEHCVTLVLNNGWKVKESLRNKWFTKKRKQFGL